MQDNAWISQISTKKQFVPMMPVILQTAMGLSSEAYLDLKDIKSQNWVVRSSAAR